MSKNTRSATRSAEERLYWLTLGELVWAACEVVDLMRRVKAKPPVKGSRHVGRGDRFIIRIGAELVAGAKDSASADSAAGQDHAITMRPVVAACTRIDLGRSPELAHCDHQGLFKKSALTQITDQRCICLVSRRNQIVLEASEDVGVGIPVGFLPIVLAVVYRDKSHTGLDKATSQESALAEFVASIAIAQLWVL